jgi:hypothetical protein
MNDNRALFVEEAIMAAVKRLLSGRVNEILGEAEYPIPPVEFGNYRGGSAFPKEYIFIYINADNPCLVKIITPHPQGRTGSSLYSHI